MERQDESTSMVSRIHTAKLSSKSIGKIRSGPATAVLDLHGYTKERSISRMTWFLSDVIRKANTENNSSPVIVTIVTGTGSHSRDGPVIRNAVKSLLEKRRMHYVLNKGKGSFTVDASTGFELYTNNGQHFDSKVIVKSDSDKLPVGYAPANANKHGADLATVVSGNTNSSRPNHNNLSHNNSNPSILNQGGAPLPSEVLADDAIFQHVKKKSSSEASKVRSLTDRENNAVQKATSLSLKEELSTKEGIQQIENAIQLSQKEYEQVIDEEDNLQKATSLSLKEELSKKESLQQIENAIQLSQKEYEQGIGEEDDLQKALSLSLKESAYCSVDNETQGEEIEMMRLAIELSLQNESKF
eukprot:CAMPEP_0197840480 /NCGR_PEP_ID=MMETSP1437-20131217/45633_1 /TAXON_ID=49252 ORGANISM="Eucampia antarctica, Strain CCMP1452" /NCGR_SAMPLE_ID=MMETSP1437 /ASSEMBLY_ACC=CAM_ASM_001096 /LENGTH=356 /DNA_ID=CAMNT_0043450103 /DNA_START=47 /DNA_END=1120 /DNA_ORIENTATION=+